MEDKQSSSGSQRERGEGKGREGRSTPDRRRKDHRQERTGCVQAVPLAGKRQRRLDPDRRGRLATELNGEPMRRSKEGVAKVRSAPKRSLWLQSER